MTTPHAPPTYWRVLLASAVATPGLVHEAYTRFHSYSLHNQLLALSQCAERGITPGPLRTFQGWLSLGRAVRKGEKAIVLCTPFTKRQDDDEVIVGFCFRARWFTLAQTDGQDYEEVALPSWREDRALSTLGIARVPFVAMNGNVQGYAQPGRQVAISPVAALPHKTLFHEVAHIVLAHHEDAKTPRSVKEAEAEGVALLCCDALDLPGADYARGYIQSWLRESEFTEESAQRVITTAQRILAAGEEPSEGESSDTVSPPVAA